jgi:two-component system, NarL family, sensor histidine kinase UhpB
MSLVAQVFVANAAVLTIAVLFIALSPARIPTPSSPSAALLLAAGLGAILLVNLALLRHALAPLDRLAEAMRRAEPLSPGERVPVSADNPDVLGLSVAFNDMLSRLEEERRLSARRTLQAQEDERRRVAQELHDEVGQTLTAVVLQLDRLSRVAPPGLEEEARDAREAVRQTLQDVRRIAHRLLPEALEELGLANALASLCDRIADHGALAVERRFAADLPPLRREQELVVYRVAQEALTNVLRHAQACRVKVDAVRDGDSLVVRVADDGRGIRGARQGAGIQGMRERALTVGGRLDLNDGRAGTTVVLTVPLDS